MQWIVSILFSTGVQGWFEFDPGIVQLHTIQRCTFHSYSDLSWQAVNTKVRISPLDGLLPCLSSSPIYCFH